MKHQFCVSPVQYRTTDQDFRLAMGYRSPCLALLLGTEVCLPCLATLTGWHTGEQWVHCSLQPVWLSEPLTDHSTISPIKQEGTKESGCPVVLSVLTGIWWLLSAHPIHDKLNIDQVQLSTVAPSTACGLGNQHSVKAQMTISEKLKCMNRILPHSSKKFSGFCFELYQRKYRIVELLLKANGESSGQIIIWWVVSCSEDRYLKLRQHQN